jgi:hypothetical protein
VVELKRRCEESRDQGAAAMNGHHDADEVAGPADAG